MGSSLLNNQVASCLRRIFTTRRPSCREKSEFSAVSSTVIFNGRFSCKWGVYWNIIPMRRDCGKTSILRSLYLTGSHRTFPSQWSSSQIAMGPQRFTGQVPLQDHETFTKNTSCIFLKNIHARSVLCESFVILEEDLTCEALRSHRYLWRGSLQWENEMGSCMVSTP